MSYRETFSAEAETPDGRARATIRQVDEVEIDVDATWFAGASIAELEHQMTRLAKLLFVSRMREYYRARSAAFSQPITKESPPLTHRDHDYVDRRSQLVVEGGAGGPVHVTCVGMEQWSVTFDREWLDRIDARGFSAACGAAATELVRQQFLLVGELKQEIWG